MYELIKKTMFTGLGLAFLTKEKIVELSKDLSKLGQLSEQEGKKLFEELLKKSEEAGNELKVQIEKKTEEHLKKMNLVTRDEFRALEKKVEQLVKSPE
jgi:polyhydroxyalkanoate synthesis regulator phasin